MTTETPTTEPTLPRDRITGAPPPPPDPLDLKISAIVGEKVAAVELRLIDQFTGLRGEISEVMRQMMAATEQHEAAWTEISKVVTSVREAQGSVTRLADAILRTHEDDRAIRDKFAKLEDIDGRLRAVEKYIAARDTIPAPPGEMQ